MNGNNRFIKALKAAKTAFNETSSVRIPNNPQASKSPNAQDKSNPYKNFAHIKTTVMDLDSQYCSGCTACSNECPVQAIDIVQDEMGYYCRNVDFDKCIHCSACVKVCPVISTKYENSPNPDCYAVMAEDEIRKDSSSGGAFSLAASYVLSQGGYVCGAVLNDDFVVEHRLINTSQNLPALRRSKYVQSKLAGIFREIKLLLDTNKLVLFSGTPCQVAGLKNYLKKDYQNLILIDIFCHGAPSIKVFQKYLNEYYDTSKMKNFHFRTKDFGYNSFNQTAVFKDNTMISGNYVFDAYEKIMHSGLALKNICGDCMFASPPRQGDISIGDFWGISKYDKSLNDNLGTSCVLINNQKGKNFFEILKKYMNVCEPVPLDIPIQNNRLGRSMNIPSGRRWFYNMLDSQPIDKVVNYSLNRKFDVGIIGLWYGRNYGSMATYYALHYILKQMGLSILMIENCLKPASEDQSGKTHPFQIAKDFYDVSVQYSLDNISILNAHCDTFLVGSDQLWNIWLSRPYRQTYYLGFADDSKKKIAYGTSFGIPYCGTAEELLISKHNLQRFDHVSVRDELSKEICNDLFQTKATQVCDPAFLCPLEGYDILTQKITFEKTEKYILAYILDPNENISQILEKLSDELHCKIIIILDELPSVRSENIAKLALSGKGNIELTSDVNLYEWLWYFKNADTIITDSYHGTIFSIIYKHPFFTLANSKRGKERFESLLAPIKLENRLLNNIEELLDYSLSLFSEIDYREPYIALEKVKQDSYNWLKNALYSPKKYKSSSIFKTVDEK